MEADPVIHRCTAPDGVELAYRQCGEGRPLVLVHGFSSDSQQWIDHGLAAAFAVPGHRVIMPDLRGHGASGRPHEASAYPPDVLADDGLAVVSALGLPNNGYDLFGYSMGGRVVLRMLVRGAKPARAVIAGQGFDVTRPASDRTAGHRRLLTAMVDDTPLEPQERTMVDWMAQRGVDPQALLLVLDSFVATPPEALARITVPTLVVIGERDPRTSAAELAAAIPSAQFARVPGAHDALGRPEMLATILAFLDGQR
jgi:pimeloyl-ACP methyl ester carboxylesterase